MRYLANGEIQYLGRGDYQVKIRGHRIELGEIETALSRHRFIREVVVVAKDDVAAGKRLIAYVSLAAVESGAAKVTSADLRAFLEPSLPEIMIPAAFVILDALPLTPNGKVDRNALPEPQAAPLDASSAYLPPRNDTERALEKIWLEVLKVQRIGIEDNFFALGGHSLLVFQILSRIRDTLNIELPVKTVFGSRRLRRWPTVLRTCAGQSQNRMPFPALGARRTKSELASIARRHCHAAGVAVAAVSEHLQVMAHRMKSQRAAGVILQVFQLA